VATLYQLLLGRAPDPSGQAHWAPKVDGGTAPAEIARYLIGSTEFRRHLVDATYARTLGRTPDPSGLAYWTDRLAQDQPVVLRAGLLGSSELWSKAAGDAAAWTDRAYRALAGREATTAEHQVVDPAVAGGADRSSVATAIAELDVAHRFLAQLWYTALLDRSATPTEASAWAAAMHDGRTERSLIAELAASEAAGS
jgi:hypothetical protein